MTVGRFQHPISRKGRPAAACVPSAAVREPDCSACHRQHFSSGSPACGKEISSSDSSPPSYFESLHGLQNYRSGGDVSPDRPPSAALCPQAAGFGSIFRGRRRKMSWRAAGTDTPLTGERVVWQSESCRQPAQAVESQRTGHSNGSCDPTERTPRMADTSSSGG
jgi:hypothetical protein